MVMTEKILPDHYYDEEDPENLYGFPVVLPNPTRLEKKEMETLATFNRGVMLVVGPARSGKDLFGVSVAYQNKRYWGRPILLDFKPRRLFGEYTYFNPIMMSNEIDKMAKAANLDEGNPDEVLTKQQELIRQDARDKWIEEHEVKLKKAVIYLSELRRYCYNRNPHNRTNKDVGGH